MRKPIFVVIALLVVLLVFLVARSATPVVDLSSVTSVGQATPITVHVRDPRGIRRLQAFVEQNRARYQVFEMAQPSKAPESTWDFTAGIKTIPQLQEGKAKLIVEATSNDLLRKTGRAERDVMVVTQPPTLSVDSEQHYLYVGMPDLATFSVSGSWTEAGVRVGDQKFFAWPIPGGKPGLFSLYAFAWHMPTGTVPLVYASNGARNDVTNNHVTLSSGTHVKARASQETRGSAGCRASEIDGRKSHCSLPGKNTTPHRVAIRIALRLCFPFSGGGGEVRARTRLLHPPRTVWRAGGKKYRVGAPS